MKGKIVLKNFLAYLAIISFPIIGSTVAANSLPQIQDSPMIYDDNRNSIFIGDDGKPIEFHDNELLMESDIDFPEEEEAISRVNPFNSIDGLTEQAEYDFLPDALIEKSYKTFTENQLNNNNTFTYGRTSDINRFEQLPQKSTLQIFLTFIKKSLTY